MSSSSTSDTAASGAPLAPHFLSGGGKTGELIRNCDWARMSLGAPEYWASELKTLTAVMLGSNQPMFIVWGDERTLLYNDGYSEVLADKHPAALGRDFLDVWKEIKSDLVPIVDQALRGEPVQMDDIELWMNRKGYLEEAHFAFSYTPVRTADGGIGGFFCALLAGQAVVIGNRYRAVAVRTDHLDGRVEHRQRHAHVRRMRRDALVARAQNRVDAVDSAHRAAARTRLALVAGRSDIIKVKSNACAG